MEHMEVNHWRAKDLADLHIINSCQEMLELAQRILARMEGPISQVCGPISTGGSGSIDGNLTRFADAIAYLSGQGTTVFNQLPFEIPMRKIVAKQIGGKYAMPLLTDFYLPLFESGAISTLHFLPDWQSSFGARWEHDQAERLRMEIKYFDPHFFSKRSLSRP